ncbi:hypothetical protein [Glycomyces sp. NPDC047010]|uniref:hypothetical protein n=1 Tax=Glycomyces sp. NPDC047010 TaxID=3155023 RepID=UPI0033CBA85A
MNDIDTEHHQSLGTGLRLALAGFLDGGPGGLWGVWNLPDRWHLEDLPDLSATFIEHQMAGCDLREGIALLAAELVAATNPATETDLVGLALIWPGFHSRLGTLGMCLASVGDTAHQIVWPAAELEPVGGTVPAGDLAGTERGTVLAALADLFAALTAGPDRDGGQR